MIDGKLVALAREGDSAALNELVARVQKPIYRLALRMLWHPEDAKEATQEILVRIVTRLGSFRGESAFLTWAYRVAANHLLSVKRHRLEEQHLTFELMARDLADGLDAGATRRDDPETSALLEEVRIGCTLAMLSCLDRPHRLAYILGEIMELTDAEGAAVLEISATALRKRLSRARQSIVDFMSGHCGLVRPENACRCHRRLGRAVALKRVDPERLHYVASLQSARRFPEVLETVRALEQTRRAAALLRAQPEREVDFTPELKRLLRV
jgi:RNA polymerase sigma factor (sigma-70 family)